jgi:hypothetical protein
MSGVDSVPLGGRFVFSEVIERPANPGVFETMQEKDGYGGKNPDKIEKMMGLAYDKPEKGWTVDSENPIGSVGDTEDVVDQGNPDDLHYGYGSNAEIIPTKMNDGSKHDQGEYARRYPADGKQP